MTVLVTGGTGFVGTRIVHALRARELPVRALVRDPRRGTTLEAWGCEFARGDVTDGESLRRAVDGVDAVVHLVAIIKGRPADFRRVMEEGTAALIRSAEEAGVSRIVLMSALGTSEENSELVPYFHAKWEMEQALAASPVESVVFRPSFVFGADGGVLPTFVRQVRWSPVTPIVGSGEGRLQPIWVDDVAAFFASAVDRDRVGGTTFELGGPDVLTWNELYARIRGALGARRATVHMPVSVMRAGATLTDRLPGAPITRDQLTMLVDGGDQTCDISPAVDAFRINPIGVDEQIRRVAS